MHNHNTLRVEGPNGFVLDLPNDFSVMGRVMTRQIPGQVTVDRASYTASAAGNKLDVFASAFPTTQTRLPGQADAAGGHADHRILRGAVRRRSHGRRAMTHS